MYSFFFRKLQKGNTLAPYWAVIGREGSSEKSYEKKYYEKQLAP